MTEEQIRYWEEICKSARGVMRSVEYFKKAYDVDSILGDSSSLRISPTLVLALEEYITDLRGNQDPRCPPVGWDLSR